MRVAIIHDWLVINAGAERVLRDIIDIYADADVFSLVDFLSNTDKLDILGEKKVKTTFIQKLPFAKKYFRYYLFLFPLAIESIDLSKYDLIISSSWAVAKGVKKSKSQKHICYCHTPIRYAWDLYEEYVKNLNFIKKVFVKLTLFYIRKWDIETLDRVDLFIANSQFIKERIKRIYKKESIVINPSVDKSKFILCEKKEDFFITISRLVSYKKTKLIVEAFNEMPNKKLIVVGNGEEYNNIKKIAKENITFLGYVDEYVKINLLQKAKAFVYSAIEDFGIVIIESHLCGTPTIVLNQGATKDSVKDGINGVHFKYQTKKSIINVISEFDNMSFDKKSIRDSALEYIYFKDRFKNMVDICMKDK
jgi:glycosyltransferase involved in cell wall biosynthesis